MAVAFRSHFGKKLIIMKHHKKMKNYFLRNFFCILTENVDKYLQLKNIFGSSFFFIGIGIVSVLG